MALNCTVILGNAMKILDGESGSPQGGYYHQEPSKGRRMLINHWVSMHQLE